MFQLVAALTSLYDSLCRDYFPRDLDEISDCHILLSVPFPLHVMFLLFALVEKKKKQQTNKPSI